MASYQALSYAQKEKMYLGMRLYKMAKEAALISLIPRPSPCSVFDLLQHAKMEEEKAWGFSPCDLQHRWHHR